MLTAARSAAPPLHRLAEPLRPRPRPGPHSEAGKTFLDTALVHVDDLVDLDAARGAPCGPRRCRRPPGASRAPGSSPCRRCRAPPVPKTIVQPTRAACTARPASCRSFAHRPRTQTRPAHRRPWHGPHPRRGRAPAPVSSGMLCCAAMYRSSFIHGPSVERHGPPSLIGARSGTGPTALALIGGLLRPAKPSRVAGSFPGALWITDR